jgi:predicted phage terminase large subunit-like protein
VPRTDKITRLEAETPRIEAGHMLLPGEAPWLGDFLAELLAFPNGRHDDQVDSVSQFLHWAWQDTRRPKIALFGGEVIVSEV